MRVLLTMSVLVLTGVCIAQLADELDSAIAHHSGDLYNCDDFPNQLAAQEHLNAHPGDPDNLDSDHDGIACESLPCPCWDDVTPSASPTPAPTPLPAQERWGDSDCDEEISSRDNQALLRKVLQQNALGQTEPCPDLASVITVDSLIKLWGDWDCDGDVSSRDNQALLRSILQQVALSQTQPCPALAALANMAPGWRDGRLHIQHIDVEEGDAALLISPTGQVAMIDNGRTCSSTVEYVQLQNVAQVDYHFATHYDADHNSCLDDIVEAGIPVGVCYDRGGSAATDAFRDYALACEGKRQTATKGQVIALGGGVEILVVDLNGAGIETDQENALGLVLKLSYGEFDHEFAGDIPGEDPDIESIVAPEIGDVDVCKVHHHGSRYSSNANWLNATHPEVCILSVGDNGFRHPHPEALERLRDGGVTLYWTNEGSGGPPGDTDTVLGNVVVSVDAAGVMTIWEAPAP